MSNGFLNQLIAEIKVYPNERKFDKDRLKPFVDNTFIRS